jgi:hypothetical protein
MFEIVYEVIFKFRWVIYIISSFYIYYYEKFNIELILKIFISVCYLSLFFLLFSLIRYLLMFFFRKNNINLIISKKFPVLLDLRNSEIINLIFWIKVFLSQYFFFDKVIIFPTSKNKFSYFIKLILYFNLQIIFNFFLYVILYILNIVYTYLYMVQNFKDMNDYYMYVKNLLWYRLHFFLFCLVFILIFEVSRFKIIILFWCIDKFVLIYVNWFKNIKLNKNSYYENEAWFDLGWNRFCYLLESSFFNNDICFYNMIIKCNELIFLRKLTILIFIDLEKKHIKGMNNFLVNKMNNFWLSWYFVYYKDINLYYNLFLHPINKNNQYYLVLFRLFKYLDRLFYDNHLRKEKIYKFFVEENNIIFNKFWNDFDLHNFSEHKKLKFIYEFFKNIFDVFLLDKDFFFITYEFFIKNKNEDINFFLNSNEFISIINRIDNK